MKISRFTGTGLCQIARAGIFAWVMSSAGGGGARLRSLNENTQSDTHSVPISLIWEVPPFSGGKAAAHHSMFET